MICRIMSLDVDNAREEEEEAIIASELNVTIIEECFYSDT